MAVDYNVTLFQVLLPAYVKSFDRCKCNSGSLHQKVYYTCHSKHRGYTRNKIGSNIRYSL